MTKLNNILNWPWRIKKLGVTQAELAGKASVKPHKLQTLIRAAKLVTDDDEDYTNIETMLNDMEANND